MYSPKSAMRLDAHQHFWHYNPAEYAWIADRMAVLKRDFLPPDLEPLLHSAGFAGCIAIQARQNLEETRWLLELAGRYDFICGVVGWVDLRSPGLAPQLEQFAGNPKLVGIRHMVQDEPDDNFLLRKDFCRGIGQLRDFGLAYDLLVYPRQLPAAVKLVSEFPAQRFVLDHLAKPPIAQQKLASWDSGIRELAKLPNVLCKLSGMVTEAPWNAWQAADFHPCLDVAFDAFGPARLMIGSDWPVCLLSSEYASAMKIVVDYIAPLSATDQDAILGQNCARFYRIGARS